MKVTTPSSTESDRRGRRPASLKTWALGVDRDGAHVEHAILRLLTRQGASDDSENLATSHTNEHEHEHTHVRGRKGRRPGQR